MSVKPTVYKVVAYVVDPSAEYFGKLDDLVRFLENQKYVLMNVDSIDQCCDGVEWSDDHPANKKNTDLNDYFLENASVRVYSKNK